MCGLLKDESGVLKKALSDARLKKRATDALEDCIEDVCADGPTAACVSVASFVNYARTIIKENILWRKPDFCRTLFVSILK